MGEIPVPVSLGGGGNEGLEPFILFEPLGASDASPLPVEEYESVIFEAKIEEFRKKRYFLEEVKALNHLYGGRG